MRWPLPDISPVETRGASAEHWARNWGAAEAAGREQAVDEPKAEPEFIVTDDPWQEPKELADLEAIRRWWEELQRGRDLDDKEAGRWADDGGRPHPED